MEANEIEPERIPHFNKNFYYNQVDEQRVLQECYNTRIDLHFGRDNAARYGLHLDFADQKQDFEEYLKWLPQNRRNFKHERGAEESQINSMINTLKNKSGNGKFDFN